MSSLRRQSGLSALLSQHDQLSHLCRASISEVEKIWNEDAIGADNTVAVHIRHIREKIEINPKEPRYLKVVWGVGYKIEKQ